MPFEEFKLSRGNPASRIEPDKWYLALGRKPRIRILLPRRGQLADADRVRILRGTGEDEGWIMLKRASELGRKITRSPKSGPYLLFSTLPRVPSGIRVRPMAIKHVDMPDGSVKLRLPWYDADFKPDPVEDNEPKGPEQKPVVSATKPASPTTFRQPDDTVFSTRKAEEGFAPSSVVRSPPPALRQQQPNGSSDAEKIKQFVESKGVSHCLSPEQAAEYLRQHGRRCVVQLTRQKEYGASTDVRWLDRPTVLLDGVGIPIKQLFEIVNEYRDEEGLPRISPPAETVAA